MSAFSDIEIDLFLHNICNENISWNIGMQIHVEKLDNSLYIDVSLK
jgi:hypothetical protein